MHQRSKEYDDKNKQTGCNSSYYNTDLVRISKSFALATISSEHEEMK